MKLPSRHFLLLYHHRLLLGLKFIPLISLQQSYIQLRYNPETQLLMILSQNTTTYDGMNNFNFAPQISEKYSSSYMPSDIWTIYDSSLNTQPISGAQQVTNTLKQKKTWVLEWNLLAFLTLCSNICLSLHILRGRNTHIHMWVYGLWTLSEKEIINSFCYVNHFKNFLARTS